MVQKWKKGHFSVLGEKDSSRNMSTFSILEPQRGKMGPFLHFGSQSAKKGARNRLFNKPFGPGRQMKPKMRFWAQKCDFGGQNGILGPKSPKSAFLDPKITF